MLLICNKNSNSFTICLRCLLYQCQEHGYTKHCSIAGNISKSNTAVLNRIWALQTLQSVIPNLTGQMQFLTSYHLPVSLWSKFNLDLCKVIFRLKIYKPCLILSGRMCQLLENRLMLKTKTCRNVPSSLELLSVVSNLGMINTAAL